MKRVLSAALLLFCSTMFAQSWVQMGSTPIAKHHPISFSLNGKGYAITGSLAGGVLTKSGSEYDPATDTWTALPDFPGDARSFGIGAVTNGFAYLGFGASSSQLLNDFWRYDGSTGTWLQLADCGCSGRRHPAMIAIGNKIYVGLGDDALGDRDDWWMYDITTNTWVQIADLPGQERHHPYMFEAGGSVYAGLGHSGNVIYQDWYKLDTASNTWTAMNPFPGEARVAGTQFSLNGLGYVLSGDGDNHNYMATGEMWSYDPSNDTWLQLTPHPGESRWAPGSFVIDQEVYFFGGLNRLADLYPTDVWKYSFASFAETNESFSSNISIYPNPANDFISWTNDEKYTTVRIYNSLGQLVLNSPSTANKINTTELNEGFYLMNFYDETNLMKTTKVLIQH